MFKENEKTNVMRILTAKNVNYISFHYPTEKSLSATEIAEKLNLDLSIVFKTLVTVGKSKQHYVFVVPATSELDLKKAANAVSEKFIEMIPQKELLPLTGYIHGGCSFIGLKKPFPVVIDSSALNCDSIVFSAGKIGYHVQVKVHDLGKIGQIQYKDVII